MTAPTPRQFDQAVALSLSRIRGRLAELPELYAVAYEASGWKVVRDSAGKISRGSVSDPTAEIVGDPRDPQRPGRQRAIRAALEGAEGQLANAENSLGEIERRILKAMDGLDPRETWEPTRFPITVTHQEMEVFYAAQVRRKARGEVE